MESQNISPETTSPHTQGIRITKKQSKWLTVVGGVFSAAVIGSALFVSASSAESGSGLRSSMTIVAPAAAGGGWDTVAREMQQAQRANGIVNNTQVVNMPGAAGTIALENLGVLAGEPNHLMVGGTGQLAGYLQYGSKTTYDDVSPLAVTVEEYDVIVVPADSPYNSLDELVTAWKQDPSSVAWTGGGAFDQLVVADLALSSGLDVDDMVYVNSDGGGEATQAMINGTAQASASGYPDTIDQIEAGRLKALALVAEEPVEGIDIPTTVEQGHDVTLANWRILLAPGKLSDEEKSELESIVVETVETPEWQAAIENYHWNENVITGDELKSFLQEETEKISDLQEELGL